MKKLFSILFAILLGFVLVGSVFADATYTTTNNGKSANIDYSYGAVIDQTNGYTQHVDSEGAAYVQEKVQTSAVATGATLDSGTAMVSTACRVSGILYGGTSATAGDYVLIYDAASATGTPVFDVSVGTAKSTVPVIIPGGVKFSTGVFADSNDSSGTALTILYDD